MSKLPKQNSKQTGKKNGQNDKSSQQIGFLPCFSKHVDSKFAVGDFYCNSVFVTKVQEFSHAIVTAPNIPALKDKIHPKGGIQIIDPAKNKTDRDLCESLGWQTSKVYRVDYGDNAYRLLFGLNNVDRRCYILALDTTHQTRKGKHK